MVSFQCHNCGDVVKKPKLDQHRSRCHGGFDCIDCSTSFHSPADYKTHTSCISEAEKYQKSLYKGPKAGPGQRKGHDTTGYNQRYRDYNRGYQNGRGGYGTRGRGGRPPLGIPGSQATGANDTPLGTPTRMSPVSKPVEAGEEKVQKAESTTAQAETSAMEVKEKKDNDKKEKKEKDKKDRKRKAEDEGVRDDAKSSRKKVKVEQAAGSTSTPDPSSSTKEKTDKEKKKREKKEKEKKEVKEVNGAKEAETAPEGKEAREEREKGKKEKKEKRKKNKTATDESPVGAGGDVEMASPEDVSKNSVESQGLEKKSKKRKKDKQKASVSANQD